jgi:hypothetical protein
MKNIIFVIAIGLMPVFSMAQNPNVKAFYDKYMDYENVTNVSLQGWVLKMAANFSDDENGEKILQKITKLRVMVMEEQNLVSKNDYQSLVKSIEKDRFEKLMQIREGGEKIDFFIQEDGDQISNLLMLINGDDEFILVSLEGNLKFSDLKELNFEIDGGDQFKKIPKKKKDVPRA